jgi:hypothetical protein
MKIASFRLDRNDDDDDDDDKKIGVDDNIDNDNNQHENDGIDSDDASSLSSTPVMVLRRLKKLKQKRQKQQQQQQQQQTPSDSKKEAVRNGTATKNKKLMNGKNETTTVTAKKSPVAKNKTKSTTSTKSKAKQPPSFSTSKRVSSTKKENKNEDTVKKPQAKQQPKENATKSLDGKIEKNNKASNVKTNNNTTAQKLEADDADSSSGASSSSGEDEEPACCLCYCGVDCSDRALFFPKDRKQELEEDEDYYFTMDDPYLDKKVYDRNNALVYCDSCNRLYHQKCHFVPLLTIPRGDWNCLVCSIQQRPKPTSPNKSSKNRKKSTSTELALPIHDSPSLKKFLNKKVTETIFQTPSRLEEMKANGLTIDLDRIKSLQHEWEIASAVYKAHLWHRQLKQLKTFLCSQASNIRMANQALATLTSTKRNRQHFSAKAAKSQELAQTIVRQTGAKFKIRDALISLESYRARDEPVNFACLIPWCTEYPQHASHVFPFGLESWENERRIVPRTKERKLAQEEINNQEDSAQKTDKFGIINIPNEIHVKKNCSDTKHSCSKPPNASPRPNKKKEKKTGKSKKDTTTKSSKMQTKNDDDDGSSGISLDDLQCSVCMIGDASDENDVILCDGQSCHRAFHMKCVYPHITEKDLEDEDQDWFCPLCSGISNLMGEMHDLCIAAEEVGDDDEGESLASWDDVQDVFPDSEWEFETAMKLLKGKRNEDTQRLLSLFLGEDISMKPGEMPVGSDSEDENDYSLFDEGSFEERKRKEREEQSAGDDSTCSSDASLVDMSSVEYEVGKDELAALSEPEDSDNGSGNEDDSSDEENSDDGRVRRSRRIRKRMYDEEEGESKSAAELGADFSEANIIEGKRKRQRVDYRKLNDLLFGDLDDSQKNLIDDADDFETKKRKAKKKNDESDNDSNDSNDEDNDDESSNNSGGDDSEGDDEDGSQEDQESSRNKKENSDDSL